MFDPTGQKQKTTTTTKQKQQVAKCASVQVANSARQSFIVGPKSRMLCSCGWRGERGERVQHSNSLVYKAVGESGGAGAQASVPLPRGQ